MVHDRHRQVPIAVVGVGALLPGGCGSEAYWRTLVGGHDRMDDVPPHRWLIEDHYDPDPLAPDKTYAKRGAFLPASDFDPSAFGITPHSLEATDTSQLLALLVAEQVLTDLTGASELDRERTAVVLGAGAPSLMIETSHRIQRPVWVKALRESGLPELQVREICDRILSHYPDVQEASFPGSLGNVISGRIANRFDLHGTNHVADAACASSFAALSTAVAELCLGRADMVISGGVDTFNDVEMYLYFSKTPALSRTGDCRPFAEAADGTMLGEGLVMYALKRLADAERDCDHVYAVLRGIGTSSDGRGTAVYAPTAQGQARALRRAYQEAGYGPDTVGLVEAHGTATPAGDAAEFAALREVFADSERTDPQWCALGSVKSQIGHTKCTAGAAGLLKAALALHHKALPPTIKVGAPNPSLELSTSPFHLNTTTRPWIHDGTHPRRASVSSFGFGGTNFHITMEEYVPTPDSFARPAPRLRAVPSELVLLSAPSPQELTRWPVDDARPLAEIARDSQRAFTPAHPARLAIVATDTADLARKLARATTLVEQQPDAPFSLPGGVHYATGEPAREKVAFLFPGQGSQHVDMGADLAVHLPSARAVWDEFVTHRHDGLPLHRVVFPPSAFTDAERAAQHDLLTATEWAQPALAVHELALLALLRDLGLRPDHVVGHSFGELTALHAAGVLDAASLVRLARERGEAMREAAEDTPGAMIAVTARRSEVDTVLSSCGEGIWRANHNASDQFVLSGTVAAIEEAEGKFAAQGSTTRRLDASAAFHSPLVADAARRLRAFLDDVEVTGPRVPVHGNQDAAPYPAEAKVIRDRIAGHVAAPVLFEAQVEALYTHGVRTFVEVGPGAVLTGLVARVLGDRAHLAAAIQPRGRDGVTGMHETLGRLAVHGLVLDFDGLWRGYDQPRRSSERRTPAMAVSIDGGNHGRRYPPAGGASALPPPNPPRQETEVPSHPPTTHHDEAAHHNGTVAPLQDSAWLAAIEAAQRSTAETHAAVQRMLIESHQDFLRMSEASFSALVGAQPGSPLPVPPPTTMPAPTMPAPTMPAATPTPMTSAPAMPAPAALPGPAATAVAMPPAPPTAVPPMTATTPAPSTLPAPVRPAGLSREELTELVLSVVADRTGYPAAILDLDMELEGDLGIDSIKRVEILASLRDRTGDLPESDLAELGQLRTLREVIDQVRVQAGGGTATDAVSAQPVAASTAALDSAPVPVTRYAVRPVPAPVPGLALAGVHTASFAVLDGGSGLAEQVAAELRRHGISAQVVDEVPAEATGVVHLGGLADLAENARTHHHEVFAAARAVAVRFTSDGGVFVTVQDTGGDFGASSAQAERACLGGIAALTRTAAAEWPSASVKAIDCQRGGRSPREVAEAVVAELLHGGAAPTVGLRADGTRLVPLLLPAPATPAGEPPVDSGSVVVATGGARGVTAAALLALATTHRPRLVLIGRTALTEEPPWLAHATDEAAVTRALGERDGATTAPTELAAQARRILAAREVRATLDALERAGSRVRYLALDVRDERALADALAEVRREWGPITGLVHGAGVLADKRIADKTDEQHDLVVGTKVAGLHALLAATANDPLRLLLLFSSVVAVTGNPGQADYAAANEVLHHVAAAERARRPEAVVRAVAWGPWDGGMVTPALAAQFTAAGVPLIPTEAGVKAFTAELTAPTADTCVAVVAGTGLLAPPPRRAEARITAETHPHLTSGLTVLPPAVALDWLISTATGWRPGADIVLRDFRVLGEAVLDGHPITVHGTAEGRLELRTGEPRFTAECPAHVLPPAQDVVTGDVPAEDFRTPDWPDAPGAAVLDGALRLAERRVGKPVRGVAEVRVHGNGSFDGTATCFLRSQGTTCDVAVHDAGGPRLRLLGVEFAGS